MLPLLLILFITIIFSLHKFTKRSASRIFLVDFSCFKLPESQKCTPETLLDGVKKQGILSDESLSFMATMMNAGGNGYLPQNILSVPPNLSLEATRNESEMVIFGAIDSLMAKTKVEWKEIGILIVNCTVFNPVPSLSSIIVNRYKLREDICCYNLTGMGCSSSLLATGLANKLLQVHRNSYALVVSSENTTSGVYSGSADLSKMILNCIFRCGGCVALLSNKPSDHDRSKYELLHTAHTHTASSDLAYRCIYQEEDSDGVTGITTTKNLIIAASSAIDQHLLTLRFLILPLSERLLLLINTIRLPKPYNPKFNRCAEHFLPHVGGKPVQDAVRKKLGFDDAVMEASRMTLHKFGNTSNSSIWYELAYVEAKGRVKKGDRVWQMAYGSGFKCSSVVMRALRDVDEGGDEMNPWMSDIDDYPLDPNNAPSFLNTYLLESPKPKG